MKQRILLLSLVTLAIAVLSGCNGIDKVPGTSGSGGSISVQFVQLPTPTLAGQPVGLVANALNDTKNAGVTWSCTPVGTCGTFNPATTAYNADTQYTPPTISTINMPVQITATSVSDSSQSATATVLLYAGSAYLSGQYAFVIAGQGSFGMVGSLTLDGKGNVTNGEVDASANGFYDFTNSITGTYTLDSTGHGNISITLPKTSCCGMVIQTHGITATSSSHLVIAEEDQFNGFTIGGVGSMDLQTASFSASQVSGGYSFTLAGYSHAKGANASWGGVFTADGVSALNGGIYDENFGGGSGYSSVPFTGSFTAPDALGRGTLTFSATPDTAGSTQYAYYVVTPEVLRITAVTNTGNAGNTGSAYGQGSVGTTDAALTGNFIFSDYGFTSDANGGESGAAAGQFTTDGSGNITAGTMDLNAFGTVSSSSFAGSTYSFSGSPRGTITGTSGQTYNVYLTDPNLNLLDPNNTSGAGGALLLETDTADTIGIVIPQTNQTATPAGAYAVLLSDQSNPPGSDGGFTGDFTVSSTIAGTFSGEGDFQGCCHANATLITGPLSGTFAADSSNPGRYTATISTTPCYPTYVSDSTSPTPCGTAFKGTTQPSEQVSLYLANGSQGFVVETDSIAPVFGVVEAQAGVLSAAQKRQRSLQQARSSNSSSKASSQPVNGTTQHSEILRRSR
jgi:hypothetical protein